MNLSDVFLYAFNGIRSRQLRSYLTILGIVIGIAAIVALLSVGFGLDSYIRSQLSFFGPDKIQISPGTESQQGPFVRAGVLTEEDARALSRIPHVKNVGYFIGGRARVTVGNENATLIVSGGTPVFFEMYNFSFVSGRNGKGNEKGFTVFGYDAANSLFSKKVKVGDIVLINDRPFRVIGILEKQGTGLFSFIDNFVYVNLDDGRELIENYRDNKNVLEIHLQVDDAAYVPSVVEDARQILRRRHRVREGEEDFTIFTADSVLNTVGAITATLTLFLGGIAAISLLVGGIGIANTMFMAVLERTREIGILKSLGMSNSLILYIFLIESGLLGLLGGIIGVTVGVLISFGISFIAKPFGLSAVVTPELIIFSILFSFIIGVLSGYLPARRAASLEPVEALRYE